MPTNKQQPELKREIRSFGERELRFEEGEDGKSYFTGYAARFNVPSHVLGGKSLRFREVIKPGAFTRALAEKQDVKHLVNHDPNQLLGRTGAGTTELFEDAKGLRFRTLAGTRSYEMDLRQSMQRGEIGECSFGFFVKSEGQRWSRDPNDSNMELRELTDVDLDDVSIVTNPAYPGTSAEFDVRSYFPDGVPREIRAHFSPPAGTAVDKWTGNRSFTTNKPYTPEQIAKYGARKAAGTEVREVDPELCECPCESCVAGNCGNCTNTECDDPNCECFEDGEDMKMKAGLKVFASASKRAKSMAEASASARASRPELRAAEMADDGVLEVLVYGDIGESWYGGGITSAWLKSQMDSAEAPFSTVRLRINSDGGDPWEAITMGNYLRSTGKRIEVFVDGIAASSGSALAMCGHEINMAPNAMMMVHAVSCMMYGNAAEMRSMSDCLDVISTAFGKTYSTRTGKPLEYITALMNAETWMGAEDCIRDGFATAITAMDDYNTEMADRAMKSARESRSLQFYRNLPERFRAAAAPRVRTKRVEGESLAVDAFLVAGDPNSTDSWKLPWKFSARDKTITHIKNSLVRLSETKDVSPELQARAWDKLVGLCKEYEIDIADESMAGIRSRLSPVQVYDLERDAVLARRAAALRAVQASL